MSPTSSLRVLMPIEKAHASSADGLQKSVIRVTTSFVKILGFATPVRDVCDETDRERSSFTASNECIGQVTVEFQDADLRNGTPLQSSDPPHRRHQICRPKPTCRSQRMIKQWMPLRFLCKMVSHFECLLADQLKLSCLSRHRLFHEVLRVCKLAVLAWPRSSPRGGRLFPGYRDRHFSERILRLLQHHTFACTLRSRRIRIGILDVLKPFIRLRRLPADTKGFGHLHDAIGDNSPRFLTCGIRAMPRSRRVPFTDVPREQCDGRSANVNCLKPNGCFSEQLRISAHSWRHEVIVDVLNGYDDQFPVIDRWRFLQVWRTIEVRNSLSKPPRHEAISNSWLRQRKPRPVCVSEFPEDCSTIDRFHLKAGKCHPLSRKWLTRGTAVNRCDHAIYIDFE